MMMMMLKECCFLSSPLQLSELGFRNADEKIRGDNPIPSKKVHLAGFPAHLTTLSMPLNSPAHSATLIHLPNPLLTYIFGSSRPGSLGFLRIGLPTTLTRLRRIDAMTLNRASLSAAALCRASSSTDWTWRMG